MSKRSFPAPDDWQKRWREPLRWPVSDAGSLDARKRLAAHRAYRPDLTESALVLIDVDKRSFDRQIVAHHDRDPKRGRELERRTYRTVLPNVIRLVKFFRKHRRPVLFVQWGWHKHQYPHLALASGEEIVIKHTRGAFASSGLDAVLRRRQVRTCFFAGADTIMCVASTVRGAIDHGYRAVLIEDACLSVEPRLHDAVVAVLGHMQAHVLSTDRVCRRIGRLLEDRQAEA